MAPYAAAAQVEENSNLDGRTWIKTPSISLVAPEDAAPHPKWLHLTNLDRVVNPTFISVISFYENVLVGDEEHGEQFSIVTAFLKRSLAKVLVNFYPLAGRLTMDETTGIVDLHCNDGGAIFREASTYMSLAEMGGPRPMPALSGMECLKSFASASPNQGLIYVPDHTHPAVPVLVVQATLFSCGSIAIAANWHHTVADAQSGCHFMKSWAEVAAGKAIEILPSYDRHLLQPRTPLDPSSVSPAFSYESGNSKSKQQTPTQNIQLKQVPQAIQATVPSWSSEPHVKPFFLSAKNVQTLKGAVNDAEGGRSGFSSAISISAGLWKLFAKAKLDEDGECRRKEKSKFFMFVEGRKKLGLPAGYFGNVVCCAATESTHEELASKPVRHSAERIKSSVSIMDAAYFRSFIDWVEGQKTASSTDFKSKHLKSSGYDMAATFWTFFPLYELDFGWGKPVLSVRNSPPRKLLDGLAMMPSPRGGGEMVALINSRYDRMQALMEDEDFQAFFDGTKPILYSSPSLSSQGLPLGYQTNALAYTVL